MPLRLDHRPPEGLSAIEHLLQPGSRAARLKLRLIYDRVECNPSCDFSELINRTNNGRRSDSAAVLATFGHCGYRQQRVTGRCVLSIQSMILRAESIHE